MKNDLQADIVDFAKLGALLLLMGVVAFDILVVRSNEKELRRTTAARMAEFEAKVKEIESERVASEADLRRRLRDAEQRVLAEKRNTKKVEEEKRQQEETYERESFFGRGGGVCAGDGRRRNLVRRAMVRV